MSIYDNNIEAIKKNKSDMFHMYKEEFDNYTYCEDGRYIISEARNKSMYSRYQINDKTIRFNSNYNPEREAKSWAGQYTFDNANSTIVMFGVAGGYFADGIFDILNDSSKLILIEPEMEVFLKSLYMYDMTKLINSNKVEFVVGSIIENNLFDVLAKYVHWSNVKKLEFFAHPGYAEVYESEYAAVKNEVQHYVDAIIIEKNTEQYFGQEIAYNTVKNIEYMLDSHYLSDFIGKFDEEMVGVIVAAGPSLDNNISVLHQMKDKAVIFATDTALRALAKEGITADFVVTIDPKKEIFLFEGTGFENIPLFCKVDSNPEIFELHKGEKIWINPSEYLCNLYDMLGIYKDGLKSGGSVATAAFSICRELGFKKIVLIGQDLAYKGEASHANGEQRKVENEEKTICYVKGNNGEMLKSRGDWHRFLQWYEKAIRELPEGVEVINATEGGAYIEGTKVMTLQQVCDMYCVQTKSVSTIVSSVLGNRHETHAEIIKDFITKSKADVCNIVKEMEKAITACNRFERKYQKAGAMTQEIYECINEIRRIGKKVGDMPVYWLVDKMVRHSDMESVEALGANKNVFEDENLSMIKKSKHIYEVTCAQAKDLAARFENVLK